MELNELYAEIVRLRRADLNKQKKLLPWNDICQLAAAYDRQHRDVQSALRSTARQGKSAELKFMGLIQKCSPGNSCAPPEFDFLQQARKFEQKKYAAVAVATEKHFSGGSPSMLTGVTHLINLPIIRWDFVIDEYEVLQAKLWGADAFLINTDYLATEDLLKIVRTAREYQLEMIAMTGTPEGLNAALQLPCPAAAVYIEKAADLLKLIPENIPVIASASDFPVPANPPVDVLLVKE